MRYIVLFLFLTACASAPKSRTPLVANGEYGAFSGVGAKADLDESAKVSTTADVIVVPQWHLSAQTNTQVSSANLPQAENQRAIYRQLTDWAENGAVKTVIVEGCEGEINDSFHERFNGWTLADLEKLSAEQLDNTMTHVGLKLKAKVGRKIKVVCGDSNELVKKHQLILSDLRGFVGFKIRIEEFANDIKKRADYVATVRDLMKMPADSDEIDVLAKLDEQLRLKLKEFNEILHERDAVFVAKAKAEQGPASKTPEAIVIGAIHTDDLLKQLDEAQLSAVTFTAKGLRGDEAELLNQIEDLLAQPPPKRPKRRQLPVPVSPSATPEPQR